MGPKPIPLIERLRKRLKPSPNGCLEWQGYTSHSGYGRISRGSKSQGAECVHRAVFEDEVGLIPEGMRVLHTCDNPPCCNSKHLFLGTDADNMADKKAKGRQARGEGHGMSKLTWGQVHAIRSDDRALQEIGADHGIGKGHVSQIKRGLIWKGGDVLFGGSE